MQVQLLLAQCATRWWHIYTSVMVGQSTVIVDTTCLQPCIRLKTTQVRSIRYGRSADQFFCRSWRRLSCHLWTTEVPSSLVYQVDSLIDYSQCSTQPRGWCVIVGSTTASLRWLATWPALAASSRSHQVSSGRSRLSLSYNDTALVKRRALGRWQCLWDDLGHHQLINWWYCDQDWRRSVIVPLAPRQVVCGKIFRLLLSTCRLFRLVGNALKPTCSNSTLKQYTPYPVLETLLYHCWRFKYWPCTV